MAAALGGVRAGELALMRGYARQLPKLVGDHGCKLALFMRLAFLLAMGVPVPHIPVDLPQGHREQRFSPERGAIPPQSFVCPTPPHREREPSLAREDNTLCTMLNEAWTFGGIGTVAFYAAIALTVAAVAVLAALIFELVSLRQQRAAVHSAQPVVQAAIA